MFRRLSASVILAVFILTAFVISDTAALTITAKDIDDGVNIALKKFEQINGAKDVLKRAKGVLIFPSVFKGGFFIGGEYGEGALRIKGKSVAYYSTAAASIGFQLGGQKKTIIIAFMTNEALKQFQESEGWKIGADASVAVIAVGVGGSIDSASYNQPIIAFVLDQKGLMYNITLEGAKISKLVK